MRVYISVLLALVSLHGFSGAQNCKLANDENHVYWAVFADTRQTPIVSARPQRVPASVFNGLFARQLPEWGPPPKDAVPVSGASLTEMKQDYDRKAAQRCSLPPLSGTPITIVKESELRSLGKSSSEQDWRKQVAAYEQRFKKRFGANAEGPYWVSRIAFDRNRSMALVHVSSEAGGLLYILRSVNGHWNINRIYNTWTT